MSWWSKVVEFIRRLFGAGGLADKLVRGLDAAAPYIRMAYELAEYAARMTPTRSDDELLELARQLGVPALLEPGADRGVLIGQIVLRALRLRYPDATERALRRAIEIAYGAVRP